MNASGVPQQGLLDTAAQKTGLNGFMQKLNISRDTLIEIGVYLGVGFVAGFLLKRFSKLFLVLVLTVLFLWFLHHMEIMFVVINWQRMQELVFGAQAAALPTQADFGAVMLAWATSHVAGVISFAIGFLAGIRLG